MIRKTVWVRTWQATLSERSASPLPTHTESMKREDNKGGYGGTGSSKGF